MRVRSDGGPSDLSRRSDWFLVGGWPPPGLPDGTSGSDLQPSLDRFSAVCEEAGMKISRGVFLGPGSIYRVFLCINRDVGVFV